jgi:transposase-like protein
MASASAAAGFRVKCPFCNASTAAIKLDLNDMGWITCLDCAETFTVDQAVVRAADDLARWKEVLNWVRTRVCA